MACRLAWLQPREPWAEFHELGFAPPPVRSKCPTMALPSPSALDIQLPQVVSPSLMTAVPSRYDPVRMSCWLGLSPRPGVIPPCSLSTVSLVRLFS